MLRQTALLLTLIAALGQPALAGSSRPDAAHSAVHANPAQPQAAPRAVGAALALAPVILPPAVDDIRAGRGPGPHARAIRQIAIDKAVGNRDGAEILKAQLHAAGVSHEALRDAVTWTQVHQSAPFPKTALPARPGAGDDAPSKTMY